VDSAVAFASRRWESGVPIERAWHLNQKVWVATGGWRDVDLQSQFSLSRHAQTTPLPEWRHGALACARKLDGMLSYNKNPDHHVMLTSPLQRLQDNLVAF